MDATLATIRQNGHTTDQFGDATATEIVRIMVHHPEQLGTKIEYLTPDLFTLIWLKFIVAEIHGLRQANDGQIPSQPLIREHLCKHMDTDSPYREVLEIVNKAPEPRNVVLTLKQVDEYVRKARCQSLFSDEFFALGKTGDLEGLKAAFAAKMEEAREIAESDIMTGLIDAGELLKKTYQDTAWLVENVLVSDNCMLIGGLFKSYKTWIAIELAVAIATGKPFLGVFKVPTPKRVLLCTGEAGERELQRRLRLVLRDRSIVPSDLGDRLKVHTMTPNIGNEGHAKAVNDSFQKHKIDVCILEPLATSLLDGTSIYNVYPTLTKFDVMCKGNNVTLVVGAHFNRKGQPHACPAIKDFSGAGPSEYARQWILLGLSDSYDNTKNSVWMACGGSCHDTNSTTKRLTVDESPDSTGKRGWHITVEDAAELLRQQLADKATQRQDEIIDRLLQAMGNLHQAGETLIMKEQIKKESGMSGETCTRAINLALSNGDIEVVTDGSRTKYRRLF